MMSKPINMSKGMPCWLLVGLCGLGILLAVPATAAQTAPKIQQTAARSASSQQQSNGKPESHSENPVTEVQGISVHGTDEFPKVFNIVPWQTPTLTLRARPKLKADMPGLLTPVDPEVMERQRKFRNTLHLVNPQQGIQ